MDEREGLDNGGDVAIMLKMGDNNKEKRPGMSGGGAVGGNAKEAYRDDVERIDDGRRGRDKKKWRGHRDR